MARSEAGPHIGTAGWSIPRSSAARFPGDGTHLQRYSRLLNAAEINSSFHRPHAATTYAKWRDSTPSHFRFSIKVPRVITHELKLRDARAPLVTFLAQCAGLGEKQGPLLVQLPPSLSLDREVAGAFLSMLREEHAGPVVCEPRHATWFTAAGDALLRQYRISRVAADPPPAPDGEAPAGDRGVAYFRLHGSPRMYWSKYGPNFIASLARAARGSNHADVWCIFDNTASGAALENAWELREAVTPPGPTCSA